MVEIKSSTLATHIAEQLPSKQCPGGISNLRERTQPETEIRESPVCGWYLQP